jgi:phosphoesterase RecJ-like protein
LALYLSLKRLGKEGTIVCPDLIPSVFKFLPSADQFKNSLSASRQFVISLDTSVIKADKVMYKSHDGHLDIVITPEGDQTFDPAQVTFSGGGFNFDTIIVLDCTDLERLGEEREKNPDLFFEIPTVNIDHHAGNDHFGKVNLVDMTATSTSEIMVSVLEALTGDPKFIDEEIATALLCGIVTDTNSFQNANTTPKSLTVAAQLVAQGGHQQDIIKNIYKTKSLSTLRLWGRALSNLHDEKDYKFVWSKIYKKDYLEVDASEDEASGLIDELLKTAIGVDFALLLTERNGDLHGSLRSTNKTKDVSEIAKLFGGGGHPAAAAFQIRNSSLLEQSEKIIQTIKDFQKKEAETNT